jgi:hypothetical protein
MYTENEINGIHMQSYNLPVVRQIREYLERLLGIFRSSFYIDEPPAEARGAFPCNTGRSYYRFLARYKFVASKTDVLRDIFRCGNNEICCLVGYDAV